MASKRSPMTVVGMVLSLRGSVAYTWHPMEMKDDGSTAEHLRSAGKLILAVVAAWALFAGAHLVGHRPRIIGDGGGVYSGENCRLAPVLPGAGDPARR